MICILHARPYTVCLYVVNDIVNYVVNDEGADCVTETDVKVDQADRYGT